MRNYFLILSVISQIISSSIFEDNFKNLDTNQLPQKKQLGKFSFKIKDEFIIGSLSKESQKKISRT